jgi:hypothetical protein
MKNLMLIFAILFCSQGFTGPGQHTEKHTNAAFNTQKKPRP